MPITTRRSTRTDLGACKAHVQNSAEARRRRAGADINGPQRVMMFGRVPWGARRSRCRMRECRCSAGTSVPEVLCGAS